MTAAAAAPVACLGAVSASHRPWPRRPSRVSVVVAITGRAIRGICASPSCFIFTALIIPVFFFVVQIGALGDVAEQQLGISNYATFRLPISILFAAASTSGGNAWSWTSPAATGTSCR